MIIMNIKVLCSFFFLYLWPRISQNMEESMKKIGVVLAGSGYLDGAEIREAVLSLLLTTVNWPKLQID